MVSRFPVSPGNEPNPPLSTTHTVSSVVSVVPVYATMKNLCGTAQHSTAQHSTAQHSTAQHRIGLLKKMKKRS
jgi:hypothetical protein